MFNLLRGGSVSEYLMRIVAILMSLCIHEYAHARTAFKLGDDTASLSGRMSLNPLAHLDPIGTLMILMGAPVGWAKPVPVNPYRFNRKTTVKKGFALVSAAGPLSNVALAVLSCMVYYILAFVQFLLFSKGQSGGFLFTLSDSALKLFLILFTTNIMLAIFNLLPFPPLDGSKIYASFLPDRWYNWLLMNERYIGLAFLILFIASPGGISSVLYTLARPLVSVIDYPFSALYRWLIGLL